MTYEESQIPNDLNETPTLTPIIKTSPEWLTFGISEVNKKKSVDLKIENVGNGLLKIKHISVADKSFIVQNLSYPLTIEPNTSQKVTVSYTPTDTKPVTTTLTIESNLDLVKLKVYAGIGGESDGSGTFTVKLVKGLNILSLPNKPETPFTAKTLSEKIGDLSVMIQLDQETQNFKSFIPDIHEDEGFNIEGGSGYVINLMKAKDVQFTGTVWKDIATSPSITSGCRKQLL